MAYLRFTALILFASSAIATPAMSQPVRQMFLPRGVEADAPSGFTQMCERDRDLCLLGQSAGAPQMVQASLTTSDPIGATGASRSQTSTYSGAWQTVPQGTTLRAMVKAVNKDVNRHVIQKTDMAAMGIPEYWRRLPAERPVGDCEDIAIEKRIRLMQAGFPAERLFYGVAYVRNIGLHTVLIARLDEGDVVLDSLTPRIERWQDTHYVWLRKQVPGSPLQWERIDPVGARPSLAALESEADSPAS